jgi:hypothetical protein
VEKDAYWFAVQGSDTTMLSDVILPAPKLPLSFLSLNTIFHIVAYLPVLNENQSKVSYSKKD